jgi:TP901 family phage tail tape measure protein
MLNSLGLGFVFRCKDDTREVIEHLKGGLDDLKTAGEKADKSITSALGMSGKAIAATSLAVAAIAGAASFELAEHAEKFSSAIRQAGVASHATAEELRQLEEVAMQRGLDSIRGSSIAAAEALRELALEGMDASDATKALDGTLLLARISMGALGAKDSAGIVNDTLKEFGMRADQAGELTDKMAFAMQHFGFRAEELRGTMSGLAAGATLTKASLDDTLLAVGLVHQVFPSATKAAMSMNMAMQQLASTKGQKELRGIGVVAADSTGKVKPLVNVIEQIAKATAHMTEAQMAHKLETIAGGRAAGGLMAIIDGLRKGVKDANGNLLTGGAAIAYLREQMANTTGTARKMSEMLGDDMGGAISALKNALSNAGVAFGRSFEEPFKHLIQSANLVVRGLVQLFTQGGFTGEVREALDKNLGLKGFVEGVFMWVERIRNFFSSLGASFEAAFAPFRPVVTMLVNAFKDLGQALGITGQSADDNASTWDTFGGIGAGVGEVFANIAGTVLPVLVTAVEMVAQAVILMGAAWQSIKPTVMNVFQVLSGAFGLIGGLLTGNWKMMWDGFVDTVVGAAKLVVNIVFAALKLIAQMVDGIGAAFGKDLGVHQFLDRMQTEVNDRVSSGTSVLKSVVTGPSAPASVAAQVATGAVVAHAVSASAAGAKDSGPQEVHVHSHVTLDGEKVGEGIAKAKRSSDGRSFHAVAAHGGAF